MKRLLIFVLLISLLLTPFASVRAQQPTTNSADDNACYPGGAMFRADQPGQGCPDSWHWMCGWFLARYLVQNPLVRQTFMPEQCRSLLATLPVALGGLDSSGGDGGDNNTLGSGSFSVDAVCFLDLLWTGLTSPLDIITYSYSGSAYGVGSGSFMAPAASGGATLSGLFAVTVPPYIGNFTLTVTYKGVPYVFSGTVNNPPCIPS